MPSPLVEGVMLTSAETILAFVVEMLIAVSTIEVLDSAIAFEVLDPASCAIDVWFAVTIGALLGTGTDPMPGVDDDAFADVDAGV